MTVTRGEQLELFSAPSARTPATLLEALIGKRRQPVTLAITRNRTSWASIRFVGGAARVRLDQAFLGAPDAVIEALGEYLRSRRPSAWRTVKAFADRITPPKPSALRIRTPAPGRVHDLVAIRDRVNQRYFSGRLDCRITWGRAVAQRRRARRRSIRFGSYVRAQNLVRINPLLDDPRVPGDFMEYLVFHEMLHAVVPEDHGSGRPYHHTTFRSLERQYSNLPAMRTLSRELLHVLRSRRSV